ncbi:DUF1906 domain-containing protein [Actinomadura harenae]|uniref:DUF1906 domain-containing protein n=1 Tax=Actinomadura harenae TaxID=2483351 RepID=A0A3M2MC51_9ACTN|nr:DUF1906 domain-containing protein [Actinomadura harenae]
MPIAAPGLAALTAVSSLVIGHAAADPVVPRATPPATAPVPGPAWGARRGAYRGVVAYRGVIVPVPSGWEVHRLDAEPGTCVRLDRRAIYLGTPGEQTSCPARVIGGAEAVIIRPRSRPAASAERRGPLRADRLASLALPHGRNGVVRVPLPEAGVTITGLYGGHPEALRDVLRATRLTPAWTAAWTTAWTTAWTGDASASRTAWVRERPGPRRHRKRPGAGKHRGHGSRKRSARPAGRRAAPRVWVTGRGFDACAAPSLRAMKAWRGAYSVTNVYIGGVARGCAQPHLNARWVRAVRKMGYRLIPTYVGPQAPCTGHMARFSTKKSAQEGRSAAVDAVARARALGIPKSMPIYYDMEAYDHKAWCRSAVLRFLQSWTTSLSHRAYSAGVYSSAKSGIRDLGRAKGIVKPPSIWFAHWDGKARVYGSRYLPNSWWHPHRRIKQYRGDHKERHGGVTLYVDSNAVDGRVY